MKIYALLAAMLLSGSMVFAQSQNDPTILTVNGKNVPRSEFEYSYNKNNSEGVIDKKSVEEYVDLFVNYKLKVQAAIDAKLDTMKSFANEFHTYRDQQVRPTFITDADVEAKAYEIYKETQQRIDGAGGMIHPSHILFSFSQTATKTQQDSALAVANEVYKKLLAGADFAEMAKKYSADQASGKEGGQLPWLTKGQTVKEFEDAAYALKKGEMSRPVQSPFGYHIILMNDRGNFFSYDSMKTDVMRFIDARGIREQIIDDKLKSLAETQHVSKEELLDKRTEELSSKDTNMKYLIQEYHDGLLLYEISNRKVWDLAAKDEEGLAAYFKKNKKKYAWDQPRFKGIAYHVKDQNDVAAVKNSVKGKPFGEWAKILRETFNNDSIIRIRVEKGIFKQGDNALVDNNEFKKDTTVHSLKDYPIDATYGKIIKAPEDYTDVRAQVVADYQEVLEKLWIQDLRKKYKFTVNKDVLSTVNKH